MRRVESKIQQPFEIDRVFTGIPYDSELYVPYGKKSVYESTNGWNVFGEIIESKPEQYGFNITASGNGSVKYDGRTIRNQSYNFDVAENSVVTLLFAPDNEYRVGTVKMNNEDVTARIVNNVLTINNVSSDINIETIFEAIPPTIYSLSIKSTGNGTVSYDGNVIRDNSSSFSVVEGASFSIVVIPDEGYRVKSVVVNSVDVTAAVVNNQYTINRISKNISIEVAFETITYSLSIKATGNGSAEYEGTTIREKSADFTMVAGSSATVQFVPDAGFRIKSVKLNDAYVTEYITNMTYTVRNNTADIVLEVVFVEDIADMANAGLNYRVVSYEQQTVNVTSGDYGQVLTVPATFTDKGMEWRVVGVEAGALIANTELSAILWNAEAVFNGSVSNPNLLLYVKSAEYAPTDIQNIIIDGMAENIVLTDAANSNNFLCPKAFTAKNIVYEHHYGMMTGYKTCQGWETLVLPFDVTRILRQSSTELVSYEAWMAGISQHPFWLYSLTEVGWKAETGIAANTPYIISMPNNENYNPIYNVSGNIQFVGSNVQVKVSDNLNMGKKGSYKFIPNYQCQPASNGIYALNVSNLWSQNTISEVEGSVFVSNLRPVHPFEAYMTYEGTAAAPLLIPVFDSNEETGIRDVLLRKSTSHASWYTLDGRKLQGHPTQKGLYIINGQKVVIR